MIAVRSALMLTLGCMATMAAVGRPVSYVGGWTVIEESDRQSSSALVHYTPAPSLSLGLKTEINRDSDFAIYSAHPTFLAKRWFGADYQGNLYFHGGLGIASGINDNPGSDQMAIYGGVMADWETRSLFVGIGTDIWRPATMPASSCRHSAPDSRRMWVPVVTFTLG